MAVHTDVITMDGIYDAAYHSSFIRVFDAGVHGRIFNVGLDVLASESVWTYAD